MMILKGKYLDQPRGFGTSPSSAWAKQVLPHPAGAQATGLFLCGNGSDNKNLLKLSIKYWKSIYGL